MAWANTIIYLSTTIANTIVDRRIQQPSFTSSPRLLNIIKDHTSRKNRRYNIFCHIIIIESLLMADNTKVRNCYSGKSVNCWFLNIISLSYNCNLSMSVIFPIYPHVIGSVEYVVVRIFLQQFVMYLSSTYLAYLLSLIAKYHLLHNMVFLIIL